MLDHIDPQLPFEGRKHQATAEAREVSWQAIADTIHNARVVPLHARRRWLKLAVAAVATLLVALAAWQFLVPEKFTTISTTYGQSRRIVLPDQSVVVLNGNSSLRWLTKWDSNNGRNVWLTGEGYFEITKNTQPEMARFVVHTSSLRVTVLGTKFNVNAYASQAVVALKEGKVVLQYTSGQKAETLTMTPGQVVSLLPKKDTDVPQIITDTVTEANVSDWTLNTYHFYDTPLEQIAERILQQFGYKMVYDNQSMVKRSMNGHLNAANLEELLYAIEITLNVKIVINENDKTLTVKPK